MSRRKRPTGKQRRLERRAQARLRPVEALARLRTLRQAVDLYETACTIGYLRERESTSVVCETCGFEQDYKHGFRDDDDYAGVVPCMRGATLGLHCPGETCITAEHYRELEAA